MFPRGYDDRLRSFTQSYGSEHLDASCLLLPVVGFLPIDDPRVAGTVAAIETRLMTDGPVQPYREDDEKQSRAASYRVNFIRSQPAICHM